jgi:hypothetical protein
MKGQYAVSIATAPLPCIFTYVTNSILIMLPREL